MKSLAAGLVCALCLVGSAQAVVLEQKYQALADRWSEALIGASGQTFDDNQMRRIAALHSSGSRNWSAMEKETNRTSLWSDLPFRYDDKGKTVLGKNIRASVVRLYEMAAAYRLPGPLQNNDAFLSDTVAAMDFIVATHYAAGVDEWGNWWDWEIGIPKTLNDFAVILRPFLTREQISRYTEASRYFLPKADKNGAGAGAKVSSAPALREATGGNRTDAAQIVLLRGILAERDDEINEALAVLPDVLKTVKGGDGFYADGSFIQHDDIPYTGTYGNVLLEGLGRIMALMADTPWSERYPELLRVYDVLPDSFMPFLYAGQMMDMQSGRAVSREERQNHVEGHSVLSSMVRLMGSAPPEARKKLAGFVKAQLLADTSRDFLAHQTDFQVHATAKQILDDETLAVAEPLRGPRLYPAMDRMVWHGKDYAFALAWHSWRTGNFECMNDENRKGWFTGDGAVYVYDSDLLQYTDYWPLISPYRIAGTTLDTETKLKDCVNADKTASRVGANRNARIQWAGGTVLGSNAAVGLEFYNHDDSVSALKSWFILNDKIIAVGSDIQSRNGKKTATVADSRKLNASGDNAVLINGRSWDRANSQENMDGVETVHIAGNVSGSAMGYWFPGGASVSPEYAHVTGNWADIRTKDAGSSDRIVQGHVFSLLIPHHAGHANFYRYVMMPGASSQTLQTFARNPDVSIIRADSAGHAVSDRREKIFLINAWGKELFDIGWFSTTDPLSVILEKDGASLRVSASDPTWKKARVTFRLEGRWAIEEDSGKRVRLSADGRRVSLETTGLEGRPYAFALKAVGR